MRKSQKKSPKKSISVSQNGRSMSLSEVQTIAWLNDVARNHPGQALAEQRKLVSENPRADQLRANFYLRLNDLDLKQDLLTETEERLKKFPRDKLALSYRAHVLRLIGQIESGMQTLEKLVKNHPSDVVALNSLASAVKDLGDFERADKILAKVIAIKPSYGKAYWNRSDISSSPDKDLDQMRSLLGKAAVPDSEKHFLHFSAYRLLEKQGNLEEAFEHLKLANQLKRNSLEYAIELDLRIDQGIRGLFTKPFIESTVDDDRNDSEPIFVFGMPRSGTTLVEQIIASHSKVKAGDELSALGDATRKVQTLNRIRGEFPHWLSSLDDKGWKDIGDQYHQLTQPIRGDYAHLTDKALLNYKAVGLIRNCLPGAKLIQVDRNPMDLCFGCYRQLFSEGMKFSYDFKELAKVYASYQQLMAHWDEVLPGFVLRVKYEELVVDPKKQIASILDFCGLPHEESCFEPHKTQRSVRTLSATQVREPISTQGIQRWKKYEQHLAPLKDALLSEDVQID